jgi:plastocyanin
VRIVALAAAVALLAGCASDPAARPGERRPAPPSAKARRELHLVAGHDRPGEPCGADAGPLVEIVARETFFSPSCLRIRPGQRVVLRNLGNATHNFSLREAGIAVDVTSAGRGRTRPLPETLARGTYEFFCRFHASAGMVGTVTLT